MMLHIKLKLCIFYVSDFILNLGFLIECDLNLGDKNNLARVMQINLKFFIFVFGMRIAFEHSTDYYTTIFFE